MISFERHRERDPDWQVSENPQKPVGQRPLDAEARAMCNLVNGEHESVVDDPAEEVGGEDDDRPRLTDHHEEHGQLDAD